MSLSILKNKIGFWFGLESGGVRKLAKLIGPKVDFGLALCLDQTKSKAQRRHLGLFPSLDLTQVASIY